MKQCRRKLNQVFIFKKKRKNEFKVQSTSFRRCLQRDKLFFHVLGLKSAGDDSSTSSEASQSEFKLPVRKTKSKGQSIKRHVRSSSGYSSHTEETTFRYQIPFDCSSSPPLLPPFVKLTTKSQVIESFTLLLFPVLIRQ